MRLSKNLRLCDWNSRPIIWFMAAWLAFLKSRLLLPVDPTDDAPSGAELAGAFGVPIGTVGGNAQIRRSPDGARPNGGVISLPVGTQESVSET